MDLKQGKMAEFKNNQYSRRKFNSQILGGVITLGFSPSLLAQNTSFLNDEIDWYNAKDIGLEGKGWTDTKRYFDRLPSKAEGVVRKPVWDLSRHSAGISLRFVTDSPNIYVRYKLHLERLSMFHMPATGVSGLDLYAEDSEGIDRWVSVVGPKKQNIDTSIAKELAPGTRTYTMYLPLYNGVDDMEIGIKNGNFFKPLVPRKEKPILFYGTSIMQGACASRPGLAIPSILGRRLKLPTINLGFSGNGRMEAEVASLLAELDPCAFVIDCLPNMNETSVSERTIPLVKKLREAHKKTPILLVEDRSFTNTRFFPSLKTHHNKSRTALKKAFAKLNDTGVGNLYYLDGDNLLGEDGEAATDGSHPNDLGMVRYADAYEPILRSMLKQF
jgi:lysophospholipase L1-like esterase